MSKEKHYSRRSVLQTVAAGVIGRARALTLLVRGTVSDRQGGRASLVRAVLVRR